MKNQQTIYSVEIGRIHKQSPYNCFYFNLIITDVPFAEVINLPEVQNAINETFGKILIVNIASNKETSFWQYEIEKPRAILKLK